MAHLSLMAPLIGMIALGYGLRRLRVLSFEETLALDKLCYGLLFPALLFVQSRHAPLSFDIAQAVLAQAIFFAAYALLAFLWARRQHADTGALFQGTIRANTYTALGLGAGLLTGAELATFALLCVAGVMAVNVALTLGQSLITPGQTPLAGAGRMLLTNPLIVGGGLGLAANLAGLPPLPPELEQPLAWLAAAALPIALISLGAGLNLNLLSQSWRLVLLTGILKLLVAPLSMLALAHVMALEPLMTLALVIFLAQPASVSSYAFARKFQHHLELMAALITGQTLLAILSLPLIITCLYAWP